MFENLNQAWGFLIARHPYINIILSLIVAVVLSAGLVNLRLENDIRESFSPANSRAAYENRVYKEFYNLTVSPQRAFILFSAKDNNSMLRETQLRDVRKLDTHFTNVLKKVDPETGIAGCHPLCNLNTPFHLISEELFKMYDSGKPSEDLTLNYPMSVYRGQNLFVAMNMIGAETSETVSPTNNSQISTVKTIILWYFSRADTIGTKALLRATSLKLFEEAQKGDYLDHVKFEIFGDEIANEEMLRGAIEATTLMSIGVILLVLFVSVSMHPHFRKMRKCAEPIVVFVSIACPFLASIAAFGVITWLGNKTYTIMCVTPFLVLGVGVDDAFILIQSWTLHSNIENRAERLAKVLVNVGPSITITSLTNTISFGIGYATPTPQMSLFCFSTSVALFVDYILTFTILAPIIYLCTPESASEIIEARAPSAKKDVLILPELPNLQLSNIVKSYTNFICSKPGRIISLSLLGFLYVVSYFGVATMKSTFEPSKAFPSDSPLAQSIGSIRSVFNEFFPINIIVNRPPNISHTDDYRLFYKMVEELEELPESYGKDRTLLWLRNYEDIDRQTSDLFSSIGFGQSKYVPSYDNLDFFLETLGYPPSIHYIEHNGTKVLESFQFTIIAKNMAEWSNRAVTEERCRMILLKYPTFNATIYDGDSAVLDLLLTVKSDLIGSIVVTIICMTVICSFFINNQVGVVIIAFIISSICYVLVGMISWWGADLDPVTIVDVLLATGFSVDYTAHVAHQFYVKHGSKHDRIAESLAEMSAPMIQAGTSTVLCMLPLIFVPTYAIVAFAKTVFLVVGIGLFHGLLILPVLLSWMPDRICGLGSPASPQDSEPISMSTTSTSLSNRGEASEPFL
uniref:SSD domain-containing protein n=1 Tax=Panagrellus redivivus TaxID=6233 RepID=A0A7E4W4C6_PANRE